jgi:predicted small lipoprotein YifL
MTMWKRIALLPCTLALAACGPKSPLGFSLPDGDANRGQAAFVELRCNSCHDIEGSDITYREGLAHVTLGGPTTRVKTYGELVTSIINPSHRLAPRYPEEQVAVQGESLMAKAYLNDAMTVQQLIDLVAFMQSIYELAPPPVPTYWRIYP